MRNLLMILLLCSCTTTKNWLLDGSSSKGNITKYEWRINGNNYQGVSIFFSSKGAFNVELIVTDKNGLKDSTFKLIQ